MKPTQMSWQFFKACNDTYFASAGFFEIVAGTSTYEFDCYLMGGEI